MNAFLRVPFVLELHAPVKKPFQNRFRRMVARSHFRRLVVISQKLKDMFVEDFPELANRILVAHDGADDPRPDRHIAPSAGGFHVGYVGHLYPGRGTDLMRDLAASLPAMTLHVVGGAEDDRARFVASGLPGTVVVHGYKRPGELPAFFGRFDACIAPYERKVTLTGGAGDTSAFMSPLKIFEYMSWAKAIVASDLPVLREVLRDGENSILVLPDDKQAWVAAIERLMADAALRTRIAERARADFLRHYSWTQRASTVLQGI
jgi:glycosyltransferase involved in cell wall biosynthesis